MKVALSLVLGIIGCLSSAGSDASSSRRVATVYRVEQFQVGNGLGFLHVSEQVSASDTKLVLEIILAGRKANGEIPISYDDVSVEIFDKSGRRMSCTPSETGGWGGTERATVWYRNGHYLLKPSEDQEPATVRVVWLGETRDLILKKGP